MNSKNNNYSLGEITTLITDGKHGDCRNEKDSGYYFLSVKDITGEKLNYEKARQIEKIDFDETDKRTNLQPGDILFTNTGTIGRMAIAPNTELTRKTTFQKSVAIIKPKKEIVFPKYLYYLLKKENKRLCMFAEGTTQKNLLLKDLRSFHIGELPELHYQKKIANILGILDKKVELNKKNNETLEGVAKALFKSWFVDFDPVKAKSEDLSTGLPNDISDLFPNSFEDSDLGQIPKGWGIDVLSNHLSITKGKSYKSVELQESQNALVTLKSFHRGGGYREDGLKPYSGEYKKEQIIFPGELIIALTDVTQTADVIGRPAIVETNDLYENLIASLDVGIIRTKKKESITKEYSIQLLKTPKYVSHALSYTSGTTVLHLAKELLETFWIVIPDSRLLRFFTCFYNEILQKIDINQTNSKILAEVRDALLPKLISGELRIPDAEKMIEEVGI